MLYTVYLVTAVCWAYGTL